MYVKCIQASTLKDYLSIVFNNLSVVNKQGFSPCIMLLPLFIYQ